MARHTAHRTNGTARLALLLLLCMAGGLLTTPAFALGAAAPVPGPYTVNTTADTHCTGFAAQGAPACGAVTDSGGNISLRSALEAANTLGGNTTINLPAGTYNLSLGDLVAGTAPNTTITIHGAGAASTTIHQSTAGLMVIVQNYNVNSNVVLQMDNITVTGGSENENDPDGFGGNGGAILAGGSASASGVAVSLTNMVFSGNYCSPVSNAGCSGGAISMDGGGSLTVSNSTFSGNTASKNSGFGAGGAIYFDNGGHGGNVSITNSTFTNNTAQGNGTTGGQGGAVRLAGGVGTTYTVNTNTFTGNAANGTAAAGAHGGAIYLSLGTLSASFNRIVGNTGADSSGLYVANNSGSIGNATNNWWGCNGGPSAAPCDTALLGTPNQGGSMTVSPWIVLTNTASPNPIMVNQTTTLTADFLHNSTGGSLTTGQISLLIGLPVSWGSAVKGALSSQQTSIQSNGTATATFTASAAGAGSASATVDSGAAVASVTINKAGTTTALTSQSASTTVTGESFTVNFSISSDTGTTPTAPTGSVTVSDGANSCTGSINSSFVGSCSLTLLTAGSKTLTASYNGDSNFNVSHSSGAAHTVNKADTTTTITSESANPSVVGQTVTFHYGVAANAPGSGTPTGNVTVSDGSLSCTGTVAAGQCDITFTSAGAKSVTATYAGDSNYNASPASGSASQLVNPADTTTSITSDNPDPSGVNQSVTVKYSVAVNSPGAGIPTGNVTVGDGTVSCTGTVAAGQCSLTFTSGGSKSITAAYAGDSNFNGSSSAAEPHSVIDTTTTTTITSDNPDPSVVGQSVTVQYSVTASGGSPTGNVTVSDGTVSCTGTVAAGQCSLTFTSAGAKSLTAAYAGDGTFNPSTSAAEAHQVNPADTTTTITSDNPDPSDQGQAVTVNYSVAPVAPGAGTPTGNVTVSDGVDSCTGTVAAGTCGITLTTAGNRTLTATYAGDSNFNGSTSAGEPHAVNAVAVQITVETNPAGLSFSVDGTSYSSSQTFTWMPGSLHTLATSSPQAGSAGTQYVFNNWSDAGAISHSVTAPSAPTTYTASFDTQYQLTTAVSPSGAGTVSPASGTYYAAGAVVPLTATANAGFAFSSWTGNVANATSASTTITMSGPQSVTANFTAPTSLLYNGAQIVTLGNSFKPAALLSSSVSSCVSGQTISFSLDRDPTNGNPGPYGLESAVTNSSGQATGAAISTSGWQEGIYTITASFAGTTNCFASSYDATLAVAGTGDSASGGGWYTLAGSGRINFGFTVSKTDNTCKTNCTYQGQLLLINTGKWRLKGTLNSYVKLSTGKGAAGGVGDLYWWDSSLNGGLGDWALAASDVSFSANFFDSGKTGKQSTDSFTINIQYTPAPPQPSNLPNSNTLQVLKGGDIRVK